MKFRRRSLRTQLALIGLAAVLLPVFTLLLVVIATTSNEEVTGATSDDTIGVSVDSSSTAVPAEVVVAAVVLAVSASAAIWWWSGRAVEPMKSITDIANEIQAGSLDRRLGLEGQAREVQALGDSFDRMLDRLGRASTTQQRLIEDASHELRTPLAALAVNNEIALQNPNPTLDGYRQSTERNEALIARLQLTIDDLLHGARRRSRTEQQVDNDLMAIVARVVDQHRAVNPDVPVTVTGPPTLALGIDGPSVQRALVNLVENAARFSPAGAAIEITVLASERPELSVTDLGPGIAGDDIGRVFDRYYRADQGDGSGIGLALVKQVADAHGSIAIESPAPGHDVGTRFTITFDR